MTREQTLFFDLPALRRAVLHQVEKFDKDIHTGEIYHCGSCGIQVIFHGGRRRGLRAASQGEKGLPLLPARTLPVRAFDGHDSIDTGERREDMRLAAQSKGGYYPTPEQGGGHDRGG